MDEIHVSEMVEEVGEDEDEDDEESDLLEEDSDDSEDEDNLEDLDVRVSVLCKFYVISCFSFKSGSVRPSGSMFNTEPSCSYIDQALH